MKLSNLQKIASGISGYYDKETLEDKIEHLIEYSKSVDGVKQIFKEEAIRIIDFIDGKDGENSGYHAFLKLK